MNNSSQKTFLSETITLAKQVEPSLVRDNPRVGAILVNNLGEVVGKGRHEKWGEAHAEVNAINDAVQRGQDPGDCTLYVSLEPCSHTGKTPPCTSLIVEKGIKRVVFASADPNPRVSGMEVLRDAGIEVSYILLQEALDLNKRFFINHLFSRPLITLKVAISKNGMMADAKGNSKWITGPESRKHVHEVLRVSVDAILSTSKTVLKDDAKLNIRTAQKIQELNTVVLDKNLALLSNTHLAIHQDRIHSKLILVSNKESHQPPEHIKLVKGMYTKNGVNLSALLQNLYANCNINGLLVEAGPSLCRSLLNAELVDELVLFVGDKLLSVNEQYAGIEPNAYPNLQLTQTLTFENDICNYYSNNTWKDLLKK